MTTHTDPISDAEYEGMPPVVSTGPKFLTSRQARRVREDAFIRASIERENRQCAAIATAMTAVSGVAA